MAQAHDTTSQYDVEDLISRVDYEGYIPTDAEVAILIPHSRCPGCGQRPEAYSDLIDCGGFHTSTVNDTVGCSSEEPEAHLASDDSSNTEEGQPKAPEEPSSSENSEPQSEEPSGSDYDRSASSGDRPDPWHAIPQEIMARRAWVCYRLEEVDGRLTKVPYSPHGTKASPTESLTWSTFDDVTSAAEFDGVGYVFSTGDPYTGIDLDNSFDGNGALKPWAATIVAALEGKAYIEYSQSGNGLHLIVRGKAHVWHGKHKLSSNEQIEIYSSERYFVVTGQRYGTSVGSPGEAQAELNTLCHQYRPKDQRGSEQEGTHWSTGLSDAEAMNEALKRYGDKFARLFYLGDLSAYDDDQSSADMGLVGMLAYACGPNPDQIDRLFRASPLFRDKWDSSRKGTSYGADTIAKVLASRDSRHYYNARKHRHRHFAILDPAMLKALPRPDWQIEGIFVAKSLNVVAGAPGTYKSFLALDMGYSIARGRPWQGRRVSQGNVLIIAGESVHAQIDRLKALELTHKHELASGLDHVPMPVNLSIPQEVTALEDAIRERGTDYDVIVIDTLAQSTVGADENSNRDMGMVADVLQDLAEEFGMTIIVIHHTTKSTGSFRGASPVRGAAATEIKVEAANGLVELSCVKLRHAPAFAPITLRATPVAIPDGLTPTSLVFAATSEQMPRQGSSGAPEPQTPSEVQLLTILKTITGGKRVQRAAWWKACAAQGVAETTFERARKQLLADEFIVREGEGRSTFYSVKTSKFEDLLNASDGEDMP